jgi:lipid A 3-O-deacylase
MSLKVVTMLSLAVALGVSSEALAQSNGTSEPLTTTPSLRLPDQAPPPDPYGTFSFSIENDLFGGGTDRYYTNGFLFSWRSPSENLPRPLAALNERLDWIMGPGALRWGLSFGQSMYTPEDTERSNPDPNDRPYAGYLYGAVSLYRITARTSRMLELQVGVVGPSALGKFVQNTVHDFRGFERANGWDYELKDEPAVTGRYESKWRVPLGNFWGMETEVIPDFSFSVGNVQTYLGVGGMLRIGEGLQADFGPPRIRPALGGSGWVQPQEDFGWYLFAGIDGRGVLNDIFLDGNTWQDSRSVDKRPLVGDLQVGAAIIWRGVRFAATQVWRSEEFYGQNGTQKFGSLSVSFRF